MLARLLGLLMYPFMWPVEKGADTFIWLASSDDQAVLGAAGSYFFDRRKRRTASLQLMTQRRNSGQSVMN